jgi:hypothetical protein
MDRDDILAALTDVGRRLQAHGILGDLYLVGGAALALAYDARRTTRDVDGGEPVMASVTRPAPLLAS